MHKEEKITLIYLKEEGYLCLCLWVCGDRERGGIYDLLIVNKRGMEILELSEENKSLLVELVS
jgi:hypothetical protein